MANIIGTNPTQAITEDFGGIAQQGVSMLNAKKQREAAKLEAKRLRDQEFEDRYGINEDDYILDDTEFRTVNDATTEAVSQYRDRYYDIYQQLKEDPNNLELKKRLGNVTNSVKRMRSSHDKIKQIGEDYLAKLEADGISGVDEERWRNILEATDEGNLKIKLDENDNMQYMFYDRKGELVEVMPYNELIKGSLTDKVDLDAELDGLVGRIGTDSIDVVSGGFIKSMNQFGADQQRFVNDWIDSYLGTDDRSLEENPVLADLLNQATGGSSKKRDNFTEQDRQRVKQYLIQQTKDRFNEEIKLKQLTQPRATSAADLKKLKPQDIELAFDGGAPTRDSDGNFVFTVSKNVAIDPTKSDRKIDTIKGDKDGNIIVEGMDTIKIKGVQPDDTVESVAEREGVEVDFIEELLSSDGKVQYIKKVPFSTSDSKTINKIGNMFGVSNELGLRNVLYQNMVDVLGKEEADKQLGEKFAKKAQSPAGVTDYMETPYDTMSKKELQTIDTTALQGADKLAYYKALAKAK